MKLYRYVITYVDHKGAITDFRTDTDEQEDERVLHAFRSNFPIVHILRVQRGKRGADNKFSRFMHYKLTAMAKATNPEWQGNENEI